MTNVVRLFATKNDETASLDPERSLDSTIERFLAASAELRLAVEELSNRFDAIEKAIDTIDDADTRTRLRQSIALSRETLLMATLKLSQEIEKLEKFAQ
jgi:hypothetical protein